MGLRGLHKPNAGSQAARDSRVIKNSEVIKVGDWITDEGTGVANVDAVTEAPIGLVTGIVNNEGVSLESATAAGTYDGTWDSATRQYTATSDNETDKKVRAEFVPVKEGDRFRAKLDADKGTTTGSNLVGYYIASLTSDSSLLDESTASTTITNTQFKIVEQLPGTRDVVVEVHLRETEGE